MVLGAGKGVLFIGEPLSIGTRSKDRVCGCESSVCSGGSGEGSRPHPSLGQQCWGHPTPECT